MTVALLDIQDAPSYANATRILLVSGWQISHIFQKWGSQRKEPPGSQPEACGKKSAMSHSQAEVVSARPLRAAGCGSSRAPQP